MSNKWRSGRGGGSFDTSDISPDSTTGSLPTVVFGNRTKLLGSPTRWAQIGDVGANEVIPVYQRPAPVLPGNIWGVQNGPSSAATSNAWLTDLNDDSFKMSGRVNQITSWSAGLRPGYDENGVFNGLIDDMGEGKCILVKEDVIMIMGEQNYKPPQYFSADDTLSFYVKLYSDNSVILPDQTVPSAEGYSFYQPSISVTSPYTDNIANLPVLNNASPTINDVVASMNSYRILTHITYPNNVAISQFSVSRSNVDQPSIPEPVSLVSAASDTVTLTFIDNHTVQIQSLVNGDCGTFTTDPDTWMYVTIPEISFSLLTTSDTSDHTFAQAGDIIVLQIEKPWNVSVAIDGKITCTSILPIGVFGINGIFEANPFTPLIESLEYAVVDARATFPFTGDGLVTVYKAEGTVLTKTGWCMAGIDNAENNSMCKLSDGFVVINSAQGLVTPYGTQMVKGQSWSPDYSNPSTALVVVGVDENNIPSRICDYNFTASDLGISDFVLYNSSGYCSVAQIGSDKNEFVYLIGLTRISTSNREKLLFVHFKFTGTELEKLGHYISEGHTITEFNSVASSIYANGGITDFISRINALGLPVPVGGNGYETGYVTDNPAFSEITWNYNEVSPPVEDYIYLDSIAESATTTQLGKSVFINEWQVKNNSIPMLSYTYSGTFTEGGNVNGSIVFEEPRFLNMSIVTKNSDGTLTISNSVVRTRYGVNKTEQKYESPDPLNDGMVVTALVGTGIFDGDLGIYIYEGAVSSGNGENILIWDASYGDDNIVLPVTIDDPTTPIIHPTFNLSSVPLTHVKARGTPLIHMGNNVFVAVGLCRTSDDSGWTLGIHTFKFNGTTIDYGTFNRWPENITNANSDELKVCAIDNARLFFGDEVDYVGNSNNRVAVVISPTL